MKLSYDLNALAASFNKAAKTYDKYAFFQRQIAKNLLSRLDFIRHTPKTILNLGAGTGHANAELAKRYPNAQIISLDIAGDLLAKIPSNQICADMHALPLKTNQIDMVYSNLVIHWCNDLNQVFTEIQRVLKPDGLFIFSSLGPDTLDELRQSWASIDDEKHVHDYTDMHHVGDAMLKQGLADPVMDMEKVMVPYPDVLTLMRDIKSIGGHNLHQSRRKTLTAKSKIQRLIQAYEAFRLPSEQYPLTYEVIYGHAWGSAQSQNTQHDGEVHIPLSALRG